MNDNIKAPHRVSWHVYEREVARSRRMEFIARLCMVVVILSIGAIPLRAILPAYTGDLMTLPKTSAGIMQALWLLSRESIIPVIVGLILAIWFGGKVETKD
jgi:hypothetical protein